jgi:hypothetical protein
VLYSCGPEPVLTKFLQLFFSLLQHVLLVLLLQGLSPASVPSWQRVRAANLLASDGRSWVETFKRHNSGTYVTFCCSPWMVPHGQFLVAASCDWVQQCLHVVGRCRRTWQCQQCPRHPRVLLLVLSLCACPAVVQPCLCDTLLHGPYMPQVQQSVHGCGFEALPAP